MDEGRKRVLAIVAGILGQHLKTTGDLWSTNAKQKARRLSHRQFQRHAERTSVEGVAKVFKGGLSTVRSAKLTGQPNVSWMPPESGE
jgi:hypothetical protein